MAIELTSDMFAGNFIREVPGKRTPAKGRPNGALRRQVLLQCKHCQCEFVCDLNAARRIQQKCCSLTCHQRSIESFPGGNEQHLLYSRWLSMLQRIRNPKHGNYSNYGARGILIEDGLDSFVEYAKFAESLPGYDPEQLDVLQLDREDTNGNYSKKNLRWVDRNTQIANQRPNSRGFNTFTGVCWSNTHQRWVARVDFKGRTYCSSTHFTEEAALDARNRCIQENNLPHPIQLYQ